MRPPLSRRTKALLAAGLSLAALAWASGVRAAEPEAQVVGALDPVTLGEVVRAVGDSPGPADTRFEARRRANEAALNAIAALRSEGFYDYTVEPDVTGDAKPQAVLRITAGRRFTIKSPYIQWDGEPPDSNAETIANAVLGLIPGDPGRAADVIAAEGRVVAAAHDAGYPDALADPRRVVVDHADESVQPTFAIDTGDKVFLDGVNIVGAQRTDATWLRRLVPWKAGAVYSPDEIALLEQRLRDTGAYDTVTVSLAPKDQITAQGQRPVIVSLAERARRVLQADAGYSTAEGFGFDISQQRFNQFHRADTTALSLRLAQLEQRAGVDFTEPAWRAPDLTLHLFSSLYNEDTDAYHSTGVDVGGDVTRHYTKTSFITLGADSDIVETREKTKVNNQVVIGDKRRFVRLTGLASWSLDRSNDVLDPTRGWRLTTQLNPTFAAGADVVPVYLKAQAQGTYYLSFDPAGRTVLAARIKFGTILNGLIPEVPADRRFYAGGGGSVRGYAYQAVGPRLPDNTPQGGLSMAETSLELRQKIGKNWGAVAFIDTGSVASTTTLGGADFRAGAGIGARYDLGFGPLRADIAIPLNKREDDAAFQVYLSIGQSF